MPAPHRPPRRWDIFCRVVDNFGDAGVCWRLARQLANEFGLEVRLWIDDLASLALLCPGVSAGQAYQQFEGVKIRQWTSPFPDTQTADLVIEAFACELPENYLAAMAARRPAPGWINLEYLSAEAWVESCHGVASPHPRLPLIKHFFFPGFSAKTGGLLFSGADHDSPHPTSDTLEVSLFCYDSAPLQGLVDACSLGDRNIHCRVAAGQATQALERLFGRHGPWQIGALALEPLPFLSQGEYDRLLADCDLNFVRGEDSFVRSQMVGRPFVWQAYPQDDGAHFDKLDAFLARYTAALADVPRQALGDFFRAWNRSDAAALSASWPRFAPQIPLLEQHGKAWSETLRASGNLAENLVKFCTYRI